MDASKLSGTEAASAIDDAVLGRRGRREVRIRGDGADDERLPDTVESEIGGEASEGLRIDDLARVRRIQVEAVERDVGDGVGKEHGRGE